MVLITLPVLAYIGNFGGAAPGNLSVTINQKPGTLDPNPSYTSVFTVQFSEPINRATFTTTDITLAGTAVGQQVQSITEAGSFSLTTYEVRIQAATAGTITPSIAQELITAQNIASGTNQASTSSDNSVTYNGDWAPGEFVTTWKTDNPGSTASNTIRIPHNTAHTYNYTVDWGDGNTSSGQTGSATHTYASPGTYTVKISGTFPHIYFYGNPQGGDQQKLLTVEQWGTKTWQQMYLSFRGCSNLTVPAIDAPNLTGVGFLSFMFTDATSLNQSLNHWNVSGVISLESTFWGATSFNQPLSDWDTSNLTSTYGTFSRATSFNQPLENWDVSNVLYMTSMFNQASSFNQSLNNWNVSSAQTMDRMFSFATSFNQPLNNWNVGGVSTMYGMFDTATSFNQPLNNWNVGLVTQTDYMFAGATSFNQPLNSWNVGSVTTMTGMFLGATLFNQSLNNWNVSNVTDMSLMLWSSGLSTVNYDDSLVGWSQRSLQSNVNLDAGSIAFCNAVVQRQTIIDNFSWTINDGGQNCSGPLLPFIFRVKTDNTGTIETGDTQFLIPANITDYAYNYNVDCDNDGTAEYVNQTGDVTCNYGVAGEYDIAISGTYPHMPNSTRDPDKIIEVKQWGDIEWQDMRYMFHSATYMQMTASDTPNLTSVFNMERMFFDTNFFNSNIESWDVSNVTNMSGLFANAMAFNQPLSSWNLSNVTDTSFMFDDATSFNQSLNDWDVSSVTNMSGMFEGANSFNQPLNSWDTSSVTDMSGMFFRNTGFNQDISSWNTSNVTSFIQMFLGATSFNQPLNSWDTSNVVFFQGAFFGATSFNQPLDNWDISSGDSLQFMFAGATAFNQDLSSWSTSSIANMSGMFTAASSFDQSLASWDVSNVADMTFMFGDGGGFFPESSGLSTANYDATLISWSAQNLEGFVTFDAGISTYCNSETQRQSIIDNKTWIINDTGKNCTVTTEPFIFRVKTDNPGGNPNEFIIPANTDDYSYNYNVDCDNDGDVEFTSQTSQTTCNYVTSGEYEVAISGVYPHMNNGDYGQPNKIIEVKQWGDIEWASMNRMFATASQMILTSSDTPNLTNVTDMTGMFQGASSFNSDINNWDVSNVTNMARMFNGATSFNRPLNSWDVSNVTDMSLMFADATSFNQNINNWNVSSVTDMSKLFYDEYLDAPLAFNQPLNSWDVSNVTDMQEMFANARSFNQDISSWDVSSVQYMGGMFSFATAFNQPLNNWNTSAAISMAGMFAAASSFNQPLSSWNTNNVVDMSAMFAGASSFDQSLASWDVSNVAGMTYMFGDAGGLAPSTSGLSTANYDATLISWSAQNLEGFVTFDAGTSRYCNSEAQRQSIIDGKQWTINDNGKNCTVTTPTNPTTPTSPTTPSTPVNPTNPSIPSSPTNPSPSPESEAPTTNNNVGGGAGNRRVTPSSNQQVAEPLREPVLGAFIGPIVRIAEATPVSVARSIPWSLLLLLIALTAFYAYSSYQEQQRRKTIIAIIGRFKKSLAARATFLEITSHYIKTPITKMQGVIELLTSGVIAAPSSSTASKSQAALSVSTITLSVPESTIAAARSGIDSLNKHADELLGEGQSLTGKQQAYFREFGKHRILSTLSHPAFWLPVVVLLTLVILANILFIQVDKYEATAINLVAQIMLAVVGVLALGVSYYFLKASKEQQIIAQTQLNIEKDILDRQQQLIAAGSAKLSEDIELLSGLAVDIARYPKTGAYATGLEELQKVVSQFTKLEELSRSMPGLLWSTNLNNVLQQSMHSLQEIADQKGVSMSIQTSGDINVNIDEKSFAHLVGAPLKNALQASQTGSQVAVTVNTDNSYKVAIIRISDTGLGISAEKLPHVFEPFNSATSTERFSDTGLGLDLYLAKTIAAQYNATIELQANQPSGIIAIVTVPIAGSKP